MLKVIENRSNLTKLKDSRMKKNRFTSALLALTLITTSASMHGAEEISFEEENTVSSPAQERQVEQKVSFKEKAVKLAKKTVSESIDRLKRCLRRDCSKMEALKAARDVTFAVLVLYAAGYASSYSRMFVREKLPPSFQAPFMTATRAIGVLEHAAVTPGLMVKETAGYVIPEVVKARARKVRTASQKWIKGIPTVGQKFTDRDGEEVRVIGVYANPLSKTFVRFITKEGQLSLSLDEWKRYIK